MGLNKKILILRAAHANEYELQNYSPLADKLDIRVVTSRHPLTPVTLPTIPLWSPTDLPAFPLRRQLLNRLIGGEQWLTGLTNLVQGYRDSNNQNIVLHTAETYTPYTHQAVLLRRHGLISRLVCTCWEIIPYNNETLSRLREWKREARETVDLFHTPTKLARQALIQEGVAPSKIVVIPYGVDLNRFRPQATHIVRPRPLILTVGRQVPEKGYLLWQQLAQSFANVADFCWVSGKSYQNMPKVYQQADILLHPALPTPTWAEQYGMVLLEAMASGLAIVTTSTGAIPEVVGKAGLIVSPDQASLTSALSSLLKDAHLRHQLARRSVARAKRHYSHLASAAALAKLYN